MTATAHDRARVERAVPALVRAVPWPMVLVTALAAAVRFASLGAVPPNPFHDAAVRSMSLSLPNLFFGAFDPGRWLALDTPPLGVWLQVLSVKVLGWSGFALKLPEALAGTCAVPVLYDAVRRVMGRPAGLGSAFVLAIVPASVLTARSDTTASIMMLLLVLALWACVRACQGGGRRWLIAAGATVGLAFEVQLGVALICLPALVVLHLLAGRGAPRARARDLAGPGVALLLAGLGWAVLATLAPGHHPWPAGSGGGSVWGAMFASAGLPAPPVTAAPGGGPGPLRLLQASPHHLDRLFGSALLPALAVGVAALVYARGRPDPGRLPVAFAVAMVVWLVCGIAVFDAAGTVHARDLDAVAPAVAAVLGSGAAALSGFGPRGLRSRPPAIALTATALAAVCVYAAHFHDATIDWGVLGLLLAAGGATLLATAPGWPARAARWCTLGLILGCSLAYPLHETFSVVRSRADDAAGPPAISAADARALSVYLAPRTTGARYEVAADEPISLAPLIVRDARPILPLTRPGGDVLASLAALRAAVRSGRVRYALLDVLDCDPVHRGWASCTAAERWIRLHGVDVTWKVAGLSGRRDVLFRVGG